MLLWTVIGDFSLPTLKLNSLDQAILRGMISEDCQQDPTTTYKLEDIVIFTSRLKRGIECGSGAILWVTLPGLS